MKRKLEPIRTVSYVPLTPDESVLVCTDDMTPEQRDYIGTALTLKMLNQQFSGRAEFTAELPPPEDVFQQLSKIL